MSGTWRNPAGMGTVSLARFCAVGGSQVMSAVWRSAGVPGGRADNHAHRQVGSGRDPDGLGDRAVRAARQLDCLDPVDALSASHGQDSAGDRGAQGAGSRAASSQRIRCPAVRAGTATGRRRPSAGSRAEWSGPDTWVQPRRPIQAADRTRVGVQPGGPIGVGVPRSVCGS